MHHETLEKALGEGTLLHPTEGSANSVELFRALAILNGHPGFDRTPQIDDLVSEIGVHDHYVFVLVDGLGMMLEDRFPTGGFFETYFAREIRSVFPSTTAVALTSLATAEWPARHGLSGWWTYFPEHNRVLAPLRWCERGTETGGEELGMRVEREIAATPAAREFTSESAIVFPREIRGGAYGAWAHTGSRSRYYRRVEAVPRLVKSIVRRARGRTHTYVYIPSVDSLCHRRGVGGEAVTAEVKRVDRVLARLRDTLPADARMVVTADHGLVDVPASRQFTLHSSHPATEHLRTGPSAEPRTPVFHLKEGHEDAFRAVFADHPAAPFFDLHTPAELHEKGLFGKTDMSPAAIRNWGDLVGLSSEPVILEYTTDKQGSVGFTGFHGGLLPDEIRVPLFLS